MKVLVLPDIHLKPWILDRATGIAVVEKPDAFVFIGDLVDNWKQEYNLDLYQETFDRFIGFIKEHPNFYFCYGNHDISYEWKKPETGYSYTARPVVLRGLDRVRAILPEDRVKFVHKIDNVIFSHGGLVEEYVRYLFDDLEDDLDALLDAINNASVSELWNDISPLWARPQFEELTRFGECLQVVGHTPTEKTANYKGFVSVDSFSTFSSGEPIGDDKFAVVDTVTKEWHTIK